MKQIDQLFPIVPKTIIIRHRRENLKKCSLRGLESREDCLFFRYPELVLPDLSNYVLLAMDGPPLSQEDSDQGLLLLDGTWRYAEVMMRYVEAQVKLPHRSLPAGFRTAYPRRQEDCPDPELGLASVEALYLAYHLTGRNTDGLLDHYYWRDQFLHLNQDAFRLRVCCKTKVTGS